MKLTPAHIENLKAYYRTHAESAEQPAAMRSAYTSTIARLNALKDPTIEQLEAFIDAELVNARKCAGKPTPADSKRQYRHGEKAKKFRIGLPFISSDRWVEQPDLPDCCHGDYREWNIEGGENYQEQLYCHLLRTTVNPSGTVCENCRQNILHVQALVAEGKRKEAGDWLVQMVAEKQMTQYEALKLVEMFNLEAD